MCQKNCSILLSLKYIFVIFIVLFTTTSCGYKMAGISKESQKYNYYISSIINKDSESDYYNIMNEEIYHFFSDYGLLTKSESADYILNISLEKVDTDMIVKSTTEQAIASQIVPHLKITVKNNADKIIFSKEYKYYQIYYVTSNVSTNIQNRYEAFRTAMQYLLLDFRNDFESSQRM